jgi:hypothetical protein
MLLIVGGSKDHNIHRLANAAEWRGEECRVIYTDSDPAPQLSWRPGAFTIEINGETFNAAGTSLFIRYDVFSEGTARNAAFFDAIRGWAAANPAAGMLNRANETLEVSKPRALVWAQEEGFATPATWVTDDFSSFADKSAYIAKPVAGGDYTRLLSEIGEGADQPWIVQEKLNYPEVRLFRVGKYFFAFEITCPDLDYRISNNFTMREIDPPADLVKALQRLTDRMGLDYAAADFKTHPVTGKLLFMEVNSMPMFTGYDDIAKGRLSDALLLTLRQMTYRAVEHQLPIRLGL